MNVDLSRSNKFDEKYLRSSIISTFTDLTNLSSVPHIVDIFLKL